MNLTKCFTHMPEKGTLEGEVGLWAFQNGWRAFRMFKSFYKFEQLLFKC